MISMLGFRVCFQMFSLIIHLIKAIIRAERYVCNREQLPEEFDQLVLNVLMNLFDSRPVMADAEMAECPSKTTIKD